MSASMSEKFSELITKLGPFLAVLAVPLALWPTLVLIAALVMQSRGAMFLRPKHLAIFIGVQIVWLLLLLAFSSFFILRPLNLRI